MFPLIGWLANFSYSGNVSMAKIDILWMFLEMAQQDFMNKICFPGLISVDRIQVACVGGMAIMGPPGWRPVYTGPTSEPITLIPYKQLESCQRRSIIENKLYSWNHVEPISKSISENVNFLHENISAVRKVINQPINWSIAWSSAELWNYFGSKAKVRHRKFHFVETWFGSQFQLIYLSNNFAFTVTDRSRIGVNFSTGKDRVFLLRPIDHSVKTKWFFSKLINFFQNWSFWNWNWNQFDLLFFFSEFTILPKKVLFCCGDFCRLIKT